MQRVHRTLFVDDAKENHNDDVGDIRVCHPLFVDQDDYHDVEEVDNDDNEDDDDDDDDDGHTWVLRPQFADKDDYHHDDD